MSKQDICSFWVRGRSCCTGLRVQRGKGGMVPSSKIASAPPLATGEAPALLIRVLLKVEAQKSSCSEAFLLLFRPLSPAA